MDSLINKTAFALERLTKLMTSVMFQQSESRPFLPNPDPTLKIPGLDPTINCLLNSLHNNVKTIFKIIVSSKIPNVMYIR